MLSQIKTASFFALSLFSLCASTGFGKPNAELERVRGAYALATGALPEEEVAARWMGRSELSAGQLVAAIAESARGDESDIAERAFVDSFGRYPSAGELDTDSSKGTAYYKLMIQNVDTLANDAKQYREVIERAYRFVVGREAYEEEFKYWEDKPTLSYILLVGCIEDWAKRNQPGLMVTAGKPTISINSEYLRTVRLSPSVADDLREVTGQSAERTAGNGLVAVASDEIASGGGMRFLVIGGMSRDS